MNRIGACLLSVAFVSACPAALSYAADCEQNLNAQDRVSRFKELDRRAEAAMHVRHFSEAVHLYKQAVCLVPDSARGWYGLAMAQAASDDYATARISFQTADRLQPGSPMPLIMQVRMNFSMHKFDALKSNLRALAERFPQDPSPHKNVARYLAEKGLFDLALAEALRAQQGSSADPTALLELAGLENTAGAYHDAIRDALSIETDGAFANELRAAAAGIAGLSYESLGNSDEAVRLLKESLAFDPARENSYLALADLYDQMHRHSDAVELLTRASTRLPDSVSISLALGTALVGAEKYQEGTAILTRVLKQAPDADQAYMSLADAARKTGNTPAEIDALRRLENRKPDFPMIHVLMARALLTDAAPDYGKVLQELARAQERSASDPDIFYLRGRVHLAQNRMSEAISDLQHAIELRPLEAGPYYQLARVYQKLGRQQLAREQFDRVRYLENRDKH